MKKILVINGPNLNLLGKREKNIYGDKDYNFLVKSLKEKAKELGVEIKIFQSNSEGEIVDLIHEHLEWADGIIINPAGYTTTSVAILDALKTFEGKVIEVHISQIFKREEWRGKSLIAKRADGFICGLGIEGYLSALEYLQKI
jgi:3-dehydroquinate dehydratase-2